MNLGQYSIPDRYIRELHEYDPLVRIAWGRAEGLVRVERKVRRGFEYVPPVPDRELDDEVIRRCFDDAQMYRTGYALVLKFPPLESNWPLVLYTLAQSDLQRLGGAQRLADDLDAREAYEKARRTWNRRDDFRVHARDLYRVMNTVRTSPEGAGWRKNKSFVG